MKRDDLLLAELRAIRAELRRLGDLVELRAQRTEPRNSNPTACIAVLHARAGTLVFTARDLSIDAARPGNEALADALDLTVGSLNARRIGKWLRSVEGDNHNGLRIVRVGEDRSGAIWQVRECGSRLPQTHLAHCARRSGRA